MSTFNIEEVQRGCPDVKSKNMVPQNIQVSVEAKKPELLQVYKDICLFICGSTYIDSHL